MKTLSAKTVLLSQKVAEAGGHVEDDLYQPEKTLLEREGQGGVQMSLDYRISQMVFSFLFFRFAPNSP